ncbi:MAG: S-methyl-5-thioribose-1-phosphate isomerase [Myxococcales bacterium]|nr:S-methyl-5-thioribose-1-phosphate isomerase [Myxococcales bacterium]
MAHDPSSTGDHIRFDGTALELLDQRLLPARQHTVRCITPQDVADAIRDMVVRGAPAIGISAAYGMSMAVSRGDDLRVAAETLKAARPTAVNLAWAVDKLLALPPEEIPAAARAIHTEDVRINRAIGDHGAQLLPDDARVLTHCNAGALATGGYGTALGVVRSAFAAGRLQRVYAGETRPYLQGARLTAWELDTDGIPCTLLTDSAAASLMAAGEVNAVVVGADRVAANGDVANKIGTLSLAVLAKHYGIPFYVAVPCSTLDAHTASGAAIPIEQRDATEVRGFGEVRWAADVDVVNPAFDVTPAELVTAWITEDGLWQPAEGQDTFGPV